MLAATEAWEIQTLKRTLQYNTGTHRGPIFKSFMCFRPRPAGPKECVSIKQILIGFLEF